MASTAHRHCREHCRVPGSVLHTVVCLLLLGCTSAPTNGGGGGGAGGSGFVPTFGGGTADVDSDNLPDGASLDGASLDGGPVTRPADIQTVDSVTAVDTTDEAIDHPDSTVADADGDAAGGLDVTPDAAGDTTPDSVVADSGGDSGDSGDGGDVVDAAVEADVGVDADVVVPPVCGDGACDPNENCASCEVDCNKCPWSCGDGKCDSGETCTDCAQDCGQCPPCEALGSKNCAASEQCYPVKPQWTCVKAGSLAVGQACTKIDECAKGALCVNNQCRAICSASGENAAWACAGGLPCSTLTWADGAEVGNDLGVCLVAANCDLVTDSGCNAGETCEIIQNAKSCLTPGDAGSGAPCKAINDCQKGFFCVGPAVGQTTCLAKCRVGGTPGCTVGSCTGVTVDGKVAPDSLGVCVK